MTVSFIHDKFSVVILRNLFLLLPVAVPDCELRRGRGGRWARQSAVVRRGLPVPHFCPFTRKPARNVPVVLNFPTLTANFPNCQLSKQCHLAYQMNTQKECEASSPKPLSTFKKPLLHRSIQTSVRQTYRS